ncbi:MAG: short-chain dehydrogenase [Actinomycetia bacterium]|nr:short-chain dehydrogenase [Actinomycetes bacterium]
MNAVNRTQASPDVGRLPMAGKTVLVTGASGGIGRATALGLATMGARLAITGRDRERTEGAAREIRTAGGGQVEVLVGDLSSQSEVRRLANEVLRFAPTHAGSVVDADPRDRGHAWLDPSGHHRGRLAEPGFEDHRRSARAVGYSPPLAARFLSHR